MSRTSRTAPATLVALLVAPLMALVAVPTAAAPVPAAASATPRRMYVAVSVATVWTDPSKVRPVDRPALTRPAHPRQWIADMTPAQSSDLSASNRTQTQALYGAPVLVLAQKGAWSQVAVPRQPTPRNKLGYPGWIPTVQLTTSPAYDARRDARFALVDRGIATGLYSDRALTHRVLTVSTNTRLPVLRRTTSAIQVATPDRGPSWLPARRASVYRSVADIPRPTGADLVRTATSFVHQPYLWGGRSGFGLDCSGLTGTAYQVHGITIPRDSGPQAKDPRATRVAKADLRPGDLLFYSHSASADDIYHVAMYAGGGRMVEAYDHTTPVRVTPARLGAHYWGAVRYPHR